MRARSERSRTLSTTFAVSALPAQILMRWASCLNFSKIRREKPCPALTIYGYGPKFTLVDLGDQPNMTVGLNWP